MDVSWPQVPDEQEAKTTEAEKAHRATDSPDETEALTFARAEQARISAETSIVVPEYVRSLFTGMKVRSLSLLRSVEQSGMLGSWKTFLSVLIKSLRVSARSMPLMMLLTRR